MAIAPKDSTKATRSGRRSNTATEEPTNKTMLALPAARGSASRSSNTQGIQLYKEGNLPNNRPIGISNIEISDTMTMGNRPVSKSSLKVLEVISNRPVTASEMEISEYFSSSGSRPVAVSHLEISELYSVMGNRPVASNDIDDSGTLMGFLD